MGRLLLDRLRLIAPDPGWLVSFGVIFLFAEGGLRYLEMRKIPIFAHLPIRPGSVILLLASAIRPEASGRISSGVVNGLSDMA